MNARAHEHTNIQKLTNMLCHFLECSCNELCWTLVYYDYQSSWKRHKFVEKYLSIWWLILLNDTRACIPNKVFYFFICSFFCFLFSLIFLVYLCFPSSCVFLFFWFFMIPFFYFFVFVLHVFVFFFLFFLFHVWFSFFLFVSFLFSFLYFLFSFFKILFSVFFV